ncbi:hypothetical protein L596_015969 [Steinernema carpocapsae]|uniref:Uncharacterized protein n=1 Tax=Steinernema carpocapsae TaxID=34508 RepID=A0A4U5NHL1_STECR|nr:hypothetical protein L596_015969 [Steinernema carpocapsae]
MAPAAPPEGLDISKIVGASLARPAERRSSWSRFGIVESLLKSSSVSSDPSGNRRRSWNPLSAVTGILGGGAENPLSAVTGILGGAPGILGSVARPPPTPPAASRSVPKNRLIES